MDSNNFVGLLTCIESDSKARGEGVMYHRYERLLNGRRGPSQSMYRNIKHT
jgi:hypothetical protein